MSFREVQMISTISFYTQRKVNFATYAARRGFHFDIVVIYAGIGLLQPIVSTLCSGVALWSMFFKKVMKSANLLFHPPSMYIRMNFNDLHSNHVLSFLCGGQFCSFGTLAAHDSSILLQGNIMVHVLLTSF